MANFRALRAHAFKNQHGQCCYCQHSMWLTDAVTFARQHGLTARQSRLFQCTAEHLVARRDGGNNCQSNIAAACWWCNNRRHRRKQAPSPAIYRQLVRHRMAADRWNPVRKVRTSGAARAQLSKTTA